jgi:hypothetical protein
MASGGKRVPAKPAAVSGPGRFSQRTDSGTAQIAASGGDYGARQQMEAQQTAAPVPVGQQDPAGGRGPQGGAGQPVGGEMGAFGPTERPGESPLAGANMPSVQNEDANVEMMLRAMYQKFPTPYLGRLLNG